MKIIYIKRIALTNWGTFGVMLTESNVPFALTIERKWAENKKGESCIPKGEYPCKRVQSNKFGDTFEICNVPNRENILFHKGNIGQDSHGCVIIGEMYGTLNGYPCVLSSSNGFNEFSMMLKGQNEFKVVITEV